MGTMEVEDFKSSANVSATGNTRPLVSHSTWAPRGVDSTTAPTRVVMVAPTATTKTAQMALASPISQKSRPSSPLTTLMVLLIPLTTCLVLVGDVLLTAKKTSDTTATIHARVSVKSKTDSKSGLIDTSELVA